MKNFDVSNVTSNLHQQYCEVRGQVRRIKNKNKGNMGKI